MPATLLPAFCIIRRAGPQAWPLQAASGSPRMPLVTVESRRGVPGSTLRL